MGLNRRIGWGWSCVYFNGGCGLADEYRGRERGTGEG